MAYSDAAGLMGSAYVDVISSEFAPSSIVASSIVRGCTWGGPTWRCLMLSAVAEMVAVLDRLHPVIADVDVRISVTSLRGRTLCHA